MNKHIKEAREAFEKAIYQGRLSSNPEAVNYAGNYMYMGLGFGIMYMGLGPMGQYDSFKNINTRKYDV